MEDEKLKEEIKKKNLKKKYKRDLILGIVAVALGTLIFVMLRVVLAQPITGCPYGFCNSSTFIPSTLANYSYQSNNTAYTLYLMNDSDLSKAVSFVANGYSFTFDMALSQAQYYNSTLGAVVGGILNPSHTNISINGGSASYPNAWPNVSIVYNLTSNLVKENIIINTNSTLPANSSAADFFRFRTDLYYNSSLQVCVNGICYKNPSSLSLNTTKEIDFKDQYNNTIFYLPPITITDSNGSTVQGTYFSVLNNGVDIWYIGIPTSFLRNAVYPIDVDPSIIEIIKADWLDQNRNFIQNVYSNVSTLDGTTALIPSGNYLRVVFAQNLTSSNDITIYASGDNANDSVQVYEAGATTPFATFSNVGPFAKYRILLTNLSNDSTNSFDLLSNGDISYDYVVDPTWYNTSFNNCRNITIVNSTSSILNNFPVLVNITTTTGMLANYQDLVFVNTSCNNAGSALNFEIENYTSSNVLVWVQTNLSAANTTISMYYTNNTIVNPPNNASATWAGSGGVYMGVWHFGLNTSNGLNTSDSTGRGNNGQNINSTAYLGNNMIDGSANFTTNVSTSASANMTIAIPNTANTTLPAGMVFTVMIWFSGNNGTLFSMQNQMLNKTVSSYDPMLYMEVNGTLHAGIYTGSNPTMQTTTLLNSTTPTRVWHFAALIVNKTQNNQTLYVDGAQVANWTGTPEGPWNNTYIGTGFTNGASSWVGSLPGWDYFNGSISEVQIVNNSGSMQLVNQTYSDTFNQSTFVVISASQSFPGPWVNSSYNKCMNITINNTGSTTLTNYPSFVNVTKNSNMQSNYADLIFYNAGCNVTATALPFEIDNYTTSYADVWVLTNLSAGNNTISVYYNNNTAVTSQQNSTAVWGLFNNYAAVYHLGDLGTGTRNDSTSFRNNATPTNFTGTETNTSGQIDGAVTLNGSKYLQSLNNIGITGQQSNTITFWVYIRNISSNIREPMIGWGNQTSNGAWLADIRSGVYFFWGFGTGDWTTTTTPTINAWQYEAITFNGTAMNWSVNGVSIGKNARTPLVNASKLTIGYENDSGTIYALNGTIDEVEISNVSRTNDWINQSYYMQSAQSTYVKFGTEQSLTTSNSCTSYSGSGNFALTCSDNCAITTNYNLNYSNISFVGSGTIVIQANLTNWTQIYKANGCTIYKPNGYALVGRH
jgi:Concanavalin A-like lectin/glucanases superfamily